MDILGVNLREIVLKREEVSGDVKIKSVKNNINITNISVKDFSLNESGKVLVFSFEYSCDYEIEDSSKNLGLLKFVGDVIVSDKKKALDSVIKSWKEDKKIDDDFLVPVLQSALNTVNIEAIYLSRKVLLPTPVQLPQIQLPKKN